MSEIPPDARDPQTDSQLTLPALQQAVDVWICGTGKGYFSQLSNLAQLTEEVGEVARLINRLYGDQTAKASEAQGDLADEMADVLFVLCALANQCQVDLSAAMRLNLHKKAVRDADRHGRQS